MKLPDCPASVFRDGAFEMCAAEAQGRPLDEMSAAALGLFAVKASAS